MTLHVSSSNRFESLLDSLLDNMSGPGASPFAADSIIVPSMAVRRRIELTVADRSGICANVEFEYLAHWLWKRIAEVLPEVDESSPFAPARLSWRLFRILGEPAFTRGFPPLARYLADADELMRYELALRIATLFDQYITYRPDWLQAWSADRLVKPHGTEAAFGHEAWQAALWRRAARELGTARQHPSDAFLAAIADGSADARAAGLPDVAHVFCLPAIPPLYVRMLRELARWTDLHVYMLNPCEAYWEDIVAPRRLAELKARKQVDHHEVGNSLLAQWGAQTKAHLTVTLGAWDGAAIEESHYVPNMAGTLLAHVQQSMLDLAEIAPGSLSRIGADRSIEVHVCHSLTRQLEVLQDQLLAMFAADALLKPSDILVATPSLQDAAPLIDAVFGNSPEARRIPYTITGRARTAQNAAARALLDVMTLATSRFQASAFFELVQQPIVARRFGIDAAGLESIRAWMRDAGIRWGIDARHRAALHLPAIARHSFEDGLHRLFLGYAMPSAMQEPVGDWLAAGDAEGSAAVALGCFWRVVRSLERVQREAAMPRAAAQWLRTLQEWIDTFLAPADEDLDDMRELEVALATLHDDMSAGAAASPLGIDVVRAALAATLDDPARGGVPAGGVTFASMTSLRTLPYRVVCVIGLDDGAFPSLERPLEFDLIAAAPRPGDRQRRAEDRNVFLDLLLAARQRLYLSYTGRDIRDNSSKPPSVVIDDLLDVLVRAVAQDPDSAASVENARRRLVIDHPLQPFSADYFKIDGDDRKRSFSDEYCQALKDQLTVPVALSAAAMNRDPDDADAFVAEPALPFFRSPLPDPEEEFRVISLDRLVRFFRNPCCYLLEQRLGMRFPEGEEELEDDEPFVADWRGRTALADRLLPAMLEGGDLDTMRAIAHAGIEYPPGHYGAHLLDEELSSLRAFAIELAHDIGAPTLPPMHAAFDFTIDGKPWRLEGGFGDLRQQGLVRHRYDNVRASDYLAGWIEHLFLCAAEPQGITMRTTWHSRDGAYVLKPVADPLAELQSLVGLYASGLRMPLHFFPKSSWCYARTGSLYAAMNTWQSNAFRRFAEDRHPAYRMCLRGIDDPLDADFERCSSTVFATMLAVVDDDRLEP